MIAVRKKSKRKKDGQIKIKGGGEKRANYISKNCQAKMKWIKTNGSERKEQRGY